MAASYERAPITLVGGGLAFFQNAYIGHVTRISQTYSKAETVGRFRGHAVANAPAETNCIVELHFDDNRPQMMRHVLNKLANNYNSLTATPSLQASAQFENMEPVRLVASGTAVTLSQTGATIYSVYKKDFSVLYTQNTDYTQTSSLITRIDNGGAIASGQEVFVGYTYEDADAVRLRLGYGYGFIKGQLRVVMVDRATGKLIMFSAPYATPIGDHSLVCDKNADWGGIDLQYRILADLSADAPYGEWRFANTAIKTILG